MRFLLVERDGDTRRWLESAIQARGHAVRGSDDADQAWEAYQEEPCAIVVLEWAGPAGLLLCKRIRAAAEGWRPVILASGLSMTYDPLTEPPNRALFEEHLGERSLAWFEALLRWQHPRRGLVEPADFSSLAEDTGLILSLGNWAFREACRQLRAWIDRGVVARTSTMGRSSTVVRAILAVADELMIGVTAEGVESEAQAVGLQALGCRLGQGYYFSPPLDQDAVGAPRPTANRPIGDRRGTRATAAAVRGKPRSAALGRWL